MKTLRNLRVQSINPLLPPSILLEEQPADEAVANTVSAGRQAVIDVLEGNSDKFVVIVGPCSIHDPETALEYAEKLRRSAQRYSDELVVVMRVYFEKPRTTIGWKGLINDPDLDGSFKINDGLRKARRLLLDINGMGLPCATEFLDLITPQFISELVAWGAIGARTTESQSHRELASGISAPIGFKNGTTGDVQIAVDAVMSSSRPHRFVGVTEQGLAAIVHTSGNPHCHVILRGGQAGPNYDAQSVAKTAAALAESGARPNVMVDCSHGNSSKDYKRQSIVAESLADQLRAGQRHLIGAMLESNLLEGNQKLGEPAELVRGRSITDACMSWDSTEPVLENWAEAVRARRAR